MQSEYISYLVYMFQLNWSNIHDWLRLSLFRCMLPQEDFLLFGLEVYIQNIFITSYLLQCVEYANILEDLRQLSYGLYDVNGFQLC
jgi:hypothetical protein